MADLCSGAMAMACEPSTTKGSCNRIVERHRAEVSRAIAMPLFFSHLLRHVLLISVCLACTQARPVAAAAPHYEHRSCEAVVREWANKEKIAVQNELKLVHPKEMKLRDLLFFLHIPRTGGRTYHQCFLKNLFPPGDRCPRSYDKLRLDPSQPSCKLLSTHDDFSILSKVEPSRTSVVTNLRNPLDRVLSIYEFTVEVAARFLRLKSLNSRSPLPHVKSPSQLVSTLTIWPWKYLVPFMQHDLFTRRDARLEGTVDWPSSANTTYDAATITMPLSEFIRHPVAHELVHNGATYQVAGLTNNSCVKGADVIRRCISQYPELGYQVLYVAKRRLDAMLFVGLTEKHQDSATLFFSLVGSQVSVQSEALKVNVQQNNSLPVQEQDPLQVLLVAYNSCIDSLRSSHATRRAATLQLIRPVKFSKEERKLIPPTVVEEILALNSLDVELYKYAEQLFSKQEEYLVSVAQSQVKDDVGAFSLLLLTMCTAVGVLLFGLACLLRTRVRVENKWIPFWLRRLLLMQIHEKL